MKLMKWQSQKVWSKVSYIQKVSFVDNLTFDPVINSTLKDFNEADYEYEWKAIPRGADF